MIFLLLLVTAIIAYLCGAVNGSIITSRFLFRKDIRNYGSKNAGLTNFFRVFGLKGLAVMLAIDVLKSVAAVLIGGWLLGLKDQALIGKVFAGFCLVLGHIFPVFYNFRGGKGVLCAGIMVLLADWRVGLCCWAIFIVVVAFSRYVSLGSVCAVAAAPLIFLIFGDPKICALVVLFTVFFIIFRHTENIIRLCKGKERKLDLSKIQKSKKTEEIGS